MRWNIGLIFLFFSFNCLSVIIPDRDTAGNIVTKIDTFTAKSDYKFRGTGVSQSIAAGATVAIELAITYGHVKFNGVEVIGSETGDVADLKVLDDALGTYSTVPNATLNQFGFNWHLAVDYHKTLLSYDSDLYVGMRISVLYTNNGAGVKTVHINYFIHEVD